MNVETKHAAKSAIFGGMSNESFLTLFMIGVLVVLFGIACAFVPNFYLLQNIINLFANYWFVIILGIGVTFLLITGNFDMSVGGVIAMTGVLSVYFCQGFNVSQNALANGLGLPYGVAVALALAGAMGIGALNAFFIAKLKVPSIIVTLGHDDGRARHRADHHAGGAAQHEPPRCLRRRGQHVHPRHARSSSRC